MSFTRFNFLNKENDYILNNYRVHKFNDDNYLLTTDSGSWINLNKKEYDLVRWNSVLDDMNLYQKLFETGILINEHNLNKIIDDYRNRNNFLFNPPTLHIVVPTFKCNQKCIYCHSRAKPTSSKEKDMDEETMKQTIDFILKTPVKSLTIEFQGGDCFTNFDVLNYGIDYIKEKSEKLGKKVNTSLVTNLTMMNEDRLEIIKKHDFLGLCTSLDGPKELHDYNRKYISGEGTYEDVVYWLKEIKERCKGKIFTNALTTVTRESFKYDKKIVDEFLDLGINGVWFRFLNNLGFAEDEWDKIGYESDEFIDFWKKQLNYILSLNKKGINIREEYSNILTKKILTNRDPAFVDMQSPCGAAIGQLLYKPNGDIHTCDEGKIYDLFKLGNIKKNSYKEIFKNKTTESMIDISSKLSTICDACEWFPYCGLCVVCSYARTGDMIPHIPTEMRCKVFGEMIETVFKKIIFSKSERNIFEKMLLTNYKYNKI